MRSILVYADTSPAMETRLQSALNLARTNGGHIHFLTTTPLEIFVGMDPFGGAYVNQAALDAAEDVEKTLVDHITKRMEKEPVSWTVESTAGEPVEAVSNAALLSDLIVASIPGDHVGAANPEPDTLALAAPIPVLALPVGPAAYDPTRPVVIAWDGSAEASAAVRAAVPLLALARGVSILTVKKADADDPAFDAKAYLGYHGIAAETIEREPGDQVVEAIITDVADSTGAGLIVMGTYGHSRLREFLVGGVTRSLTRSSPYPLLLAR